MKKKSAKKTITQKQNVHIICSHFFRFSSFFFNFCHFFIFCEVDVFGPTHLIFFFWKKILMGNSKIQKCFGPLLWAEDALAKTWRKIKLTKIELTQNKCQETNGEKTKRKTRERQYTATDKITTKNQENRKSRKDKKHEEKDKNKPHRKETRKKEMKEGERERAEQHHRKGYHRKCHRQWQRQGPKTQATGNIIPIKEETTTKEPATPESQGLDFPTSLTYNTGNSPGRLRTQSTKQHHPEEEAGSTRKGGGAPNSTN